MLLIYHKTPTDAGVLILFVLLEFLVEMRYENA